MCVLVCVFSVVCPGRTMHESGASRRYMHSIDYDDDDDDGRSFCRACVRVAVESVGGSFK